MHNCFVVLRPRNAKVYMRYSQVFVGHYFNLHPAPPPSIEQSLSTDRTVVPIPPRAVHGSGISRKPMISVSIFDIYKFTLM